MAQLPVTRALLEKRPRRPVPVLAILLLALAGVAGPRRAAAQIHLATGVIVHPSPSIGSTQVGPLLSLAVSSNSTRFPLFLEGSVARTDFTSLGQDYHHNYYLLALGAAWFPTGGATRVGVRLGMGAVGEYEIVEIDSSPGGDNWISAVVPGLVLERDLGGRMRLVMGLTDYVLGPLNAIVDPDEYGIGHRILIAAGVRLRLGALAAQD